MQPRRIVDGLDLVKEVVSIGIALVVANCQHAIANMIELVAEVVSGNGRAVWKSFHAIGYLAKGIVAVGPVFAIGQRGADALVGVVVLVGKAGGAVGRGHTS